MAGIRDGWVQAKQGRGIHIRSFFCRVIDEPTMCFEPPLPGFSTPNACTCRTHETVVVELYYDGSEDILQTIRQCEEAMEQAVMNEHSSAFTIAAKSPPPASPLPSSPSGGGGGAGGASSSPPTGESDWNRYTSPNNAGRAYWHNTKTGQTVRERARERDRQTGTDSRCVSSRRLF